jgi:predicted enzyme related to lactoylglutathione lyase
MTVARLGNIMLQVADVEKAFAFYTGVFDFVEMAGMSNRPAFAAVTAGGVTVSMRAGRDGAAPSSLIELGFAVADPDYVASRIELYGGLITEHRHLEWGESIHGTDPDGYAFTLYRRAPYEPV